MDRKGDSKAHESAKPLLDDEAKEKIELKAPAESAAEGTATEGDTAADAAAKKKAEEKELKRQKKLEEEEKKKQLKLEKQKKKEEEKELKKQQKAEKMAAMEAAKSNGTAASGNNKNWNLYNQFTVGINLLDRDEKSINEHVNVSFEDVIGEPDATQGVEAAYRLSFGLFQFVRFWIYRILMFVLAVPFALFWALVFAVLSLFSVWVLTPGFRVFDIFFYFIHRLWNAAARTVLDPVFSSIALLRQSDVKPMHHTPPATTSGRSVVYNSGHKYNKLDSNEETYKSSNDQDVTLNIN